MPRRATRRPFMAEHGEHGVLISMGTTSPMRAALPRQQGRFCGRILLMMAR